MLLLGRWVDVAVTYLPMLLSRTCNLSELLLGHQQYDFRFYN